MNIDINMHDTCGPNNIVGVDVLCWVYPASFEYKEKDAM